MSDFDYVAARNSIYESTLAIHTKMVLLQLVEHMPNCHPGLDRISKRSSLCKRQVIREIKFLEECSLIRVHRVSGLSSSYSLADAWETALPVTPSHLCTPVTSDQESPDQCPTVTPPVTPSHRTRDSQSPKADLKQETKQEGKQESLPMAGATAAPAAPRSSSSNGKRRRRTGGPADPKPEHQAVIARWSELYEQHHREKPMLSAVDTRDVKRLLDALKRDGVKACELIDNAFTDPWFRDNGTVGQVANHPSKYQHPYKPNGSTRGNNTAAPQHGRPDAIKDGKPKWMKTGTDDDCPAF